MSYICRKSIKTLFFFFCSHLLLVLCQRTHRQRSQITSKAGSELKLRYPAEGAHTGRGRPPVGMLPVLAPLQEVLVPPVVGEVVEHPGAIGHHTGVRLAQLVGVVH